MTRSNWEKANRQRLEAKRRRDEYEKPNATDGHQRSYSRRSNSSEGGPLIIPFGKYKGLTLEKLVHVDVGYFWWALGEERFWGVLGRHAQEIAKHLRLTRSARSKSKP